MSEKIRVCLVGNELTSVEVYRASLSSDSATEVVGLSTVLSREGIGVTVANERPDVVLIAVDRLDGSSMDLFRSTRSTHPGVGLVLVPGSCDPQGMRLFREFLRSGASRCACLLACSPDSASELPKVVRSVAEGKVVVDCGVMEAFDPTGEPPDGRDVVPGASRTGGVDAFDPQRLCEALTANADRILGNWAEELKKFRSDAPWRFGSRRLTANMRSFLGVLVPVVMDMESGAREDLLREASHLGELRQAQGFKIGNIVDEYGALRVAIWHALAEEYRDGAATLADVARRVDQAIDLAIQTSVEVFHGVVREDLVEQTSIDVLTGLHNRAHFWDRLGQELARAKRYGQPLAVLMMDVDDFKEYNDVYGHIVGDSALVQLARILQAGSRASDCVARYGGEEFAVILPQTGAAGASAASGRIRAGIAAHPFSFGDAVERPLTISIGCAVCEGDFIPAKDLVAMADKALYEAKAEGKNRTCTQLFRAGTWARLV